VPNEGGDVQNPATELAPLPDLNAPTTSAPEPTSPPATTTPTPTPTPDSSTVVVPGVDPRLAYPGYPLVTPLSPPVTELNLPGFHLRVVPPVPPPWVGSLRGPYPPVMVPPPFPYGGGRPLQGVRDMVRGLINGSLP